MSLKWKSIKKYSSTTTSALYLVEDLSKYKVSACFSGGACKMVLSHLSDVRNCWSASENFCKFLKQQSDIHTHFTQWLARSAEVRR